MLWVIIGTVSLLWCWVTVQIYGFTVIVKQQKKYSVGDEAPTEYAPVTCYFCDFAVSAKVREMSWPIIFKSVYSVGRSLSSV